MSNTVLIFEIFFKQKKESCMYVYIYIKMRGAYLIIICQSRLLRHRIAKLSQRQNEEGPPERA